jgi:hypothetical protein
VASHEPVALLCAVPLTGVRFGKLIVYRKSLKHTNYQRHIPVFGYKVHIHIHRNVSHNYKYTQ